MLNNTYEIYEKELKTLEEKLENINSLSVYFDWKIEVEHEEEFEVYKGEHEFLLYNNASAMCEFFHYDSIEKLTTTVNRIVDASLAFEFIGEFVTYAVMYGPDELNNGMYPTEDCDVEFTINDPEDIKIEIMTTFYKNNGPADTCEVCENEDDCDDDHEPDRTAYFELSYDDIINLHGIMLMAEVDEAELTPHEFMEYVWDNVEEVKKD